MDAAKAGGGRMLGKHDVVVQADDGQRDAALGEFAFELVQLLYQRAIDQALTPTSASRSRTATASGSVTMR